MRKTKYFWVVECIPFDKVTDFLNGMEEDGFEVFSLDWDHNSSYDASYAHIVARRWNMTKPTDEELEKENEELRDANYKLEFQIGKLINDKKIMTLKIAASPDWDTYNAIEQENKQLREEIERLKAKLKDSK